MDDILDKPKVRLDFAHFEAFRDARPRLEKWELIDGELVMMPPPAIMHQRIADNLRVMLLGQIELSQPAWYADREIGVHIPEDDNYSPEPDVTVIDREVPRGIDIPDIGRIGTLGQAYRATLLAPGSLRPSSKAGT